VKSGHVLGKQQRWRWCRACGYQFTRTHGPGTPDTVKRVAVSLYGHGLSFRTIARLLATTAQTVLRWACGYVDWYCTKPEPGDAVVIKVDEMWHFLGRKTNKVWIWKTYNRDTGKLVDWECGSSDEETFRRLLARFQRWRFRLYRIDPLVVYDDTLALGFHYQGKDHTVALERTNAQQRHWIAALLRRTIVVSRSIAMPLAHPKDALVKAALLWFALAHNIACIWRLTAA
jgi:IS1 family transposase